MSSARQEDSEATPEPAKAASDEGDKVEEAGDATPAVEAPAAGPGIQLRFAGRTAVGLVREHNEDNFIVANLTTAEVKPRDAVCEDAVGERGSLFAVCDGMGGAAAGEVASQMAVDILYEALRRGGVPADRDALARRLVSAVEEAGRRIFDSAQKERSRRGMGTTATVAVLVDKVLFLAEVGDSRAYVLRKGELKQVTKDQSLVNQLIEAGHLTEDEAEAFEHSNIILQALGTSESVQVDLTFVELRKGDRLMMCSDGLSGLVHADTMREVLTELDDPSECCAKLIEYAEGGGGHDNITVIVVDFDGDALVEPKEKDTVGYVQYPLPLEAGDSSAFVDEDTTASGAEIRSAEEASTTPTVPAAAPEARPSGGGLWLASGVVALVAALAVWAIADPRRNTPAEAPETTVVPAAEAEPAPEPEPVLVKIHTDVESATLVVNGEAHGPLTAEDGKSLELRPGAYRFEAHGTDGSQAVELVNVPARSTPIDVFLKLPLGAAAPPGEPEEGVGSEQEPSEEQQAAQAAPVEVEPAVPAPRAPKRAARVAPKPTPTPTPSEQVALEPAPAPAAAPKPPRPSPTHATSSKPPKAGSSKATPTAPPAPPPPDNPIPENPF